MTNGLLIDLNLGVEANGGRRCLCLHLWIQIQRKRPTLSPCSGTEIAVEWYVASSEELISTSSGSYVEIDGKTVSRGESATEMGVTGGAVSKCTSGKIKGSSSGSEGAATVGEWWNSNVSIGTCGNRLSERGSSSATTDFK